MNWLDIVKSKNSTKQWYKTMGQFKEHTGPLASAVCPKISQCYTNETKSE